MCRANGLPFPFPKNLTAAMRVPAVASFLLTLSAVWISDADVDVSSWPELKAIVKTGPAINDIIIIDIDTIDIT